MQFGVRFLGRDLPYEPVWQAMKKFTHERNQHTLDEVWLLEHRPVFTQGQAGKPEHLLFTGDIPVVQADRGGQVTYHGPGQLTAYILFDIKRLNIGPRDLVSAIENTLVALLAEFDIQAYPRSDAPGVYVNEQKIASLGLRISKGYSFHGLALNIQMDLEPFNRINPCGYPGLVMTQMADHCTPPSISIIGQKLVDQLTQALSYEGNVNLGENLP